MKPLRSCKVHQKHLLAAFCMLSFILPSLGFCQDLRENAFFKGLTGTWIGEGEVQDQNQVTNVATNRIEASFSEDGTMFTIKGKMEVNSQTFEYRWEYTLHSIEGLYAGKFINTQGEATLFDAAIDETNLIATVTQTSGGSGDPRIELQKKLDNEKYHATFSVLDAGGNPTFSGTLTFEKE